MTELDNKLSERELSAVTSLSCGKALGRENKNDVPLACALCLGV